MTSGKSSLELRNLPRHGQPLRTVGPCSGSDTGLAPQRQCVLSPLGLFHAKSPSPGPAPAKEAAGSPPFPAWKGGPRHGAAPAITAVRLAALLLLGQKTQSGRRGLGRGVTEPGWERRPARCPAGPGELTARLLGGSHPPWRARRWGEEADPGKPLISGLEAALSLSGDKWDWHLGFCACQELSGRSGA